MHRLVLVFILLTPLGCQRESAPGALAGKQDGVVSSSLLAPRPSGQAAPGIEGARRFVAGNLDALPAAGLVILTYLERQYGETFNVNYADALAARTQTCDGAIGNAPALGLDAKGEVAAPHFFLERAFQCQTVALPSTFWSDVGEASYTDTPNLDLATLATHVVVELGCVEKASAAQMLERQRTLLFEGLNDSEHPIDGSYITHLATWLYIQAGPVEEDWVAKVRSFQRDDGGWADLNADEESNALVSLLGLWVLLSAESGHAPSTVRFVNTTVAKSDIPEHPRQREIP
jgi:hypothetical protein